MIPRRDFVKFCAQAGITMPFLGSVYSLANTPANTTKHILLYSGWQTINIGDIGHTPGTLRYLYQYMPQVKVTVWLSASNNEVDAMLQNRFPKLNIVKGKLDEDGIFNSKELQIAFNEADLFIYNSGMIFNQFWNPPVKLIQTIIKRDLKFCLYGQSFDGFKKEDEPFMSDLLSKASMIYTRDTDSFYYLRDIGFHPEILEFGPDGCFGIDVKDDDKANTYLNVNGLVENEFITVTIRTNTPKIGSNGEILSPKKPSKQEQEQNELWAKKLREIIIDFIEKTKLKVLLVPEVNKEIVHAKTFIYDRLPNNIKENVVHRATFWNVDEAASVYSKAAVVLSMEPHSCIIALANGTPIIHAFSRKHGVKAWMFRDIGLSEWLFDIDNSDSALITRELINIVNDQKRSEKKVVRAMDFVNKRSGEMMSDINALLN